MQWLNPVPGQHTERKNQGVISGTLIFIYQKAKDTYTPLSYSSHKPLPIPKHSGSRFCMLPPGF